MNDAARIEKMVGTILGLRMILTQLLAIEAQRSGDGERFRAELRKAALDMLEDWPIGSGTPEGAENIRRFAMAMVTEFPQPAKTS